MSTETQPAGNCPVDGQVRHGAEVRRYGRFTAPAQWARQFRTDLKRVMSLCIVVRAEQIFVRDEIEYFAVSEHFRNLLPGEIVPEYRWIFSDDGDVQCEEVNIS
jgi:hypothetical protein